MEESQEYLCIFYLRLQGQAQRQFKKGGKFEDLSVGECRPSALVERYDNLYTQTRLDAMDELDELESLDKVDDSGDIKNKILFSVLVVSNIIFICICSCDSFKKKVVIIYLK